MDGGAIGTLVLSIDLELDLDHHDTLHHRRLDEVRRSLVQLTAEHKTPATWAVADPLLSVATEHVLTAGCGHEMAVLGDQAWLGPGCGRVRLARELARRFTAARRAGIAVSTLALRNVEQVLDLDLLLDHGVTALCGPAVDQPAVARRAGEPPIRFGLWQPTAAWRLPPQAGWWLPAKWRIRSEIKRAIRQRSLLHLRLDALRLIETADQGLTIIGEMLKYAAQRCDSGQLRIATVGQLAAAELGSRAAVPSRSVLRPAA